MTASSGEQSVGCKPAEEPIAREPNSQHGEGIDGKTHSGDQGHRVHRVAEIDRGPISSGTLAQHVGESDAPEDYELALEDAVAPLATAIR